jgi:hypothetical protein
MSINFNSRNRPPKGPLAQLLTLVGAVLALAAAFMFSLVFFAVLAIAGLGLWLYFWWTTRGLRRQMREQRADPRRARDFAGGPSAASGATNAAAESAESGDVIEGEAVRIFDEGKPPGGPL